jgi:hypothetical protein
LRPLNVVWHRLGLLSFAVLSPVLMGVVFCATVAPIGFLMRFFGKDPLHRATTCATANGSATSGGASSNLPARSTG